VRGHTRSQEYLFAGLCLVVPLLFVVAYAANVMPVKRGALADSDCYMRLLRVQKLWDTGRWYDPVSERSNAPYGETLHWTRPFDVLLLLGAAPPAPLVGFRTALFWWGVVISPILLFCTLLVFPWVTRPLLRGDGPRLATLLFIGQISVLAAFQPGRPDHHGLLLLLFVLTLGLALRLVQEPFRPALCYAAGALLALSLWVSIESIVAAAALFAVLAGLWVWRNEDFPDKCLHLGLATGGFLCVALLIERPPHDWAAVEFDRLSIVHVCLFGLVTAVFGVLSVLTRQTGILRHRPGRLLAGAGGALVAAVVMMALFPGFSRGPWADVDPAVVRVYLDNVAEVRPLFWPHVQWSLVVPLFGTAAFCLPLLLWRSLKGPQPAAWMLVTVALILFSVLSVLQTRWCGYAQTLLVWPTAALLAGLWTRLDRWTFLVGRALAKGLLVIGCMYLLLVAGTLAEMKAKAGSGEPPKRTLLVPICRYLENNDTWQGRPARILAPIFWGGEILYRTHHEVVATPYHRNAPGILDTYHVFTATTDDEALQIVRRRKVDLILLPPARAEPRKDPGTAEASTFSRRLRDGQGPPWCRKVELPAELSSFLLFQVLLPDNELPGAGG
jgi:hypothetical protein